MADTLPFVPELPVGSVRRRASGWWGMWMVIATEGSLFAYLLFSYLYLAVQAQGDWVTEMPRFRISLPNTALLIASSAVLHWGETGIRKGARGRLMLALGAAFAMGAVFVALQLIEWRNKSFHLSDSAYASSFFVTTGFHMAHVVGGLLVLATLFLWAMMGKFGAQRHSAVTVGAMYWHFVDVVWLAVFATFYVSPYLSRYF